VSGAVRVVDGSDLVDEPDVSPYDEKMADLIGGRNCSVTFALELDMYGLGAL
jgi:hypothetical protein